MRIRTMLLTATMTMAAPLLCIGAAHADSNDKGTEVIDFPDADKLVTTNTGPDQAKIGGDHHPVRTILVRPRVSFVPELYKTIENL